MTYPGIQRVFAAIKLLTIILLAFTIFCFMLISCGRKAYVNKITDKSITNADSINEIYYSDYFSFQGADENGPVLLAIDNNRWKNDKGYGIDHFVSLYMDSSFKKMSGNKRNFPNPEKELVTIPGDEIVMIDGTTLSRLKSLVR